MQSGEVRNDSCLRCAEALRRVGGEEPSVTASVGLGAIEKDLMGFLDMSAIVTSTCRPENKRRPLGAPLDGIIHGQDRVFVELESVM